jgi:hypothetical protein
MILVFRSYVRKDRRFPQVADEAKNQKAKNALQSTIESLDLAFDSDPYRQMLAIQELKDLSIDRLALRKRVPRSVAVEMASDPFWLKEEVEPEDLRLLLTSSAVRGPLVSENSAFADQYRRFLELVEEM